MVKFFWQILGKDLLIFLGFYGFKMFSNFWLPVHSFMNNFFLKNSCKLTELVLSIAMTLVNAISHMSSMYALFTKPDVVFRIWSSTTKKLKTTKAYQSISIDDIFRAISYQTRRSICPSRVLGELRQACCKHHEALVCVNDRWGAVLRVIAII
jgi:hypothetical protein